MRAVRVGVVRVSSPPTITPPKQGDAEGGSARRIGRWSLYRLRGAEIRAGNGRTAAFGQGHYCLPIVGGLTPTARAADVLDLNLSGWRLDGQVHRATLEEEGSQPDQHQIADQGPAEEVKPLGAGLVGPRP
jgi:hypothetical protein